MAISCDIEFIEISVSMEFTEVFTFSYLINGGLSSTTGKTSIDGGLSDSTKTYLDCGSSSKYD